MTKADGCASCCSCRSCCLRHLSAAVPAMPITTRCELGNGNQGIKAARRVCNDETVLRVRQKGFWFIRLQVTGNASSRDRMGSFLLNLPASILVSGSKEASLWKMYACILDLHIYIFNYVHMGNIYVSPMRHIAEETGTEGESVTPPTTKLKIKERYFTWLGFQRRSPPWDKQWSWAVSSRSI